MKVVGIDHRGIRTSRLEETRHYYEDLIGLKRGFRPPALPSTGYWLYAGDQPIIHLVEDTNATAPGTGRSEDLTDAGGRTHIAINVEGARDAVDRFREAKVPYWDRLFRDPLMYQVFSEDPNGLLIELIDRNPGEITGPICRIVE